MTKAYVGIDPGKNGAAACLTPDKIHLHDWEGPARAAETLAAWRDQYEIRVAIEKVTSQKTDGHAFAFRFGVNFGIWQGICAANLIDPVLIHFSTWQSKLLPNWNKKGVDNKKTSIEIARRLYPAVEKSIYMQKHNGRADALLIATFFKSRDRFFIGKGV
jgi:hypothetical protein